MNKELKTNKLKKNFAKVMNCSFELIERIDVLTNSINLNNKCKFVGNFDCRFCGRSFKNNKIWIGGFFERLSGVQLMVGFWVSDTVFCKCKYGINYLPKLLKSHYSFFGEYVEIDDGYWLYVKIDSFLQNGCDIHYAKKQIEDILNDVLKLT